MTSCETRKSHNFHDKTAEFHRLMGLFVAEQSVLRPRQDSQLETASLHLYPVYQHHSISVLTNFPLLHGNRCLLSLQGNILFNDRELQYMPVLSV